MLILKVSLKKKKNVGLQLEEQAMLLAVVIGLQIVLYQMRSIYLENKQIVFRNPYFNRPWQHVLEPLYGYLLLALKLYKNPDVYSEAWNFGSKKIH